MPIIPPNILNIPPARTSPDAVLLDLFSTSPTKHPECYKNAPYLCIPPQDGKPGHLYQLCCNDWLCPRCGELRAKHEYGRMVQGCRSLAASHDLYFITVTCPGDVPLEVAEEKYLEWTNRWLDAFRLHVKRSGGNWCYASVTERQQRGHPHSHYLTAAAPIDVFSPNEDYQRYLLSIMSLNAKIPANQRFSAQPQADFGFLDLWSEWLMLAAVKAGLGVQVRVSLVDAVEGAARYVAKYLFKAGMFTEWRKGWKRVRYSQNFPKLPESEGSSAFPLLTLADWGRAGRLEGFLDCYYEPTYIKALARGCLNARLKEK